MLAARGGSFPGEPEDSHPRWRQRSYSEQVFYRRTMRDRRRTRLFGSRCARLPLPVVDRCLRSAGSPPPMPSFLLSVLALPLVMQAAPAQGSPPGAAPLSRAPGMAGAGSSGTNLPPQPGSGATGTPADETPAEQPLPSGRVVRLDDAEKIALQHQPSMMQARANTDAARGRLGQARAGLLPQIVGTATAEEIHGTVSTSRGTTSATTSGSPTGTSTGTGAASTASTVALTGTAATSSSAAAPPSSSGTLDKRTTGPTPPTRPSSHSRRARRPPS